KRQNPRIRLVGVDRCIRIVSLGRERKKAHIGPNVQDGSYLLNPASQAVVVANKAADKVGLDSDLRRIVQLDAPPRYAYTARHLEPAGAHKNKSEFEPIGKDFH